MHIIPLIIASAVATIAALSMWGVLGPGPFVKSDNSQRIDLKQEVAEDVEEDTKSDLRYKTGRYEENISAPVEGQGASVILSSEEGLEKLVTFKEDNFGSEYISDPHGRTLYVTTEDACRGDCLKEWPPYLGEGTFYTSGLLSIIIRDDMGRAQFTWDESPLYYYAEDKKVGDRNGDKAGGMWFVARP